MKKSMLALAIVIAVPIGAKAGEPSELVKRFYDQVGLEFEPSGRALFTPPASDVLEQSDKMSKGGEEVGCIDFGLAVDGQDYDDAEIARTLKLDEKVDGENAAVTASFNLFVGDDTATRQIQWILKRVGGDWKVADISSATSDWKLSEFDCGEMQ
jgi:hypothetical protein